MCPPVATKASMYEPHSLVETLPQLCDRLISKLCMLHADVAQDLPKVRSTGNEKANEPLQRQLAGLQENPLLQHLSDEEIYECHAWNEGAADSPWVSCECVCVCVCVWGVFVRTFS